MKHIGRKLLIPAVGVVLAGGSFAFLDSNTVDGSYAGQGSGAIAGYNVTNIHYNINHTNQADNVGQQGDDPIVSVSFTLNQAATSVYANITDSDNTVHQYQDCVSSTDPSAPANSWTCSPNSNPSQVGANGPDQSRAVNAKQLTVTAAS